MNYELELYRRTRPAADGVPAPADTPTLRREMREGDGGCLGRGIRSCDRRVGLLLAGKRIHKYRV